LSAPNHTDSREATELAPPRTERLPWGPLLAFALAGFICIMTETMPAGLLPQISDGLDITESAAGQWVTVYAAGTVIAALPAVTLTRGVRRKPLLTVGAAGFLVANALTALAPTYPVALAARAIAGAFSGLVWGMLAGYARRLVPPSLTGRALAVAMVGTPVALSLGTPLGTLLGTAAGWRWTFGIMSFAALALIVWMVLGVPDRPGQSAETHAPLLRVIALPGIAGILLTTLAWILAHNVLYTYIAPYLEWTGVDVRVDVVLFVFGLAALVGIWFTGMFIDRALRPLVLGSTAGFALFGTALGLGGRHAIVLWVAMVLWGFAFGGAATQIQTAHADAAGDNVDVIMGVNTVTFNSAILGGGVLGGALLSGFGPAVFPWLVTALAVVAFIIAVLNRRGFPAGRRAV
jgi:predicted MFS family arabinose efflux permease